MTRSRSLCSRCQENPPAVKRGGWCDICFGQWVDDSRTAQGLPLQVEDDATLERVAALMLTPAELARRNAVAS